MNLTDAFNSTVEDNGDIFFIHKMGSQKFEIRQAFNWLLYVSYSCFLVSLLFYKPFYIRLILAIGSIFFCVWAWTVPDIAVQIDHFCYNLAYVVINLYQNYRLLGKMVPPTFKPQEKEIYERDFKEIFNQHEFKLFLSKGKLEYLSSHESQICKVGQSFKELVYIAYINEGFTIVLEDSDENMITQVPEGSWIGIIEYAKREDYLRIPKVNKAIHDGKYELIWNISAVMRDSSFRKLSEDELKTGVRKLTEVEDDFKEFQFLKKRAEGCIIYRFSIESLEELFNEPDIPFVFKNGLQTLWLSYCTGYVVGQNLNLAEYFKKEKEKNKIN